MGTKENEGLITDHITRRSADWYMTIHVIREHVIIKDESQSFLVYLIYH